jgi:hypothetical protein
MRFSNPFMTVRSIKSYEPVQGSRSSAAERSWPAYGQKTSGMPNMPMQDKSMLLRPLNDEHLIEVYLEAKAMKLSHEFIQLIEDALRSRNIDAGALPDSYTV